MNKTRPQRGRWALLQYDGTFHDGLRFVVQRHFAYVDEAAKCWDYSETVNNAKASTWDDPWRENDDGQDQRTDHELWQSLSEANRASFEIQRVLPYENVIDIDDLGDDWFGGPHIYTTEFDSDIGPLRDYCFHSLKTVGVAGHQIDVVDFERIMKFSRRA